MGVCFEKEKKQKQKLSSLMECMQEGLRLMQEEVLSLTAKSDLSI